MPTIAFNFLVNFSILQLVHFLIILLFILLTIIARCPRWLYNFIVLCIAHFCTPVICHRSTISWPQTAKYLHFLGWIWVLLCVAFLPSLYPQAFPHLFSWCPNELSIRFCLRSIFALLSFLPSISSTSAMPILLIWNLGSIPLLLILMSYWCLSLCSLRSLNQAPVCICLSFFSLSINLVIKANLAIIAMLLSLIIFLSP